MRAKAKLQSCRTVAIAASAAGLLAAGCAHHDARSYRRGSVKDDSPAHHRPVAATAAGRPVKIASEPGGSGMPAATPVATASIARAPAADPKPAPPPSVEPAVLSKQRDVPAPPAAALQSAPPPSAAAPAPAQPDRRLISRELVAEGQRLFSMGQVMEARKRYFAAMDGMIPEVLLALARSFDGHYISKVPHPDGVQDLVRARALYERAAEHGSKDAVADLARIKAASAAPAPGKADDTLIGSDKRE